MDTHPPVRLPDGAVLRPASPADLPALARLLADRGEPDDAIDLELVAGSDDGLAGTGVVEVDGAVAATATLLDERVRVGTVTLPAGQLELVAAATAHQHRGYVRALAGWCHRRSNERGHLLQLVYGIPYFYRQFGYREAVRLHPWTLLPAAPATPGDVVVRRAVGADIPEMHRLQEQTQGRFDVALPHQPDCWRWLVGRSGSTQWVAERGGQTVGTCRSAPGDAVTWVAEVAAVDDDAARAMVAACGAGLPVRLSQRPGLPGFDGLPPDGAPPEWFLVRVADPAAALSALRPELSRRVQQAAPGVDAEVLLSFYRSHVRFRVDADGVGPVTGGGPLQNPVGQGGSGVPPDALGDLLVGGGIDAVLTWHRDAMLGSTADLLHVLFPPQSADLLSFYLPG